MLTHTHTHTHTHAHTHTHTYTCTHTHTHTHMHTHTQTHTHTHAHTHTHDYTHAHIHTLLWHERHLKQSSEALLLNPSTILSLCPQSTAQLQQVVSTGTILPHTLLQSVTQIGRLNTSHKALRIKFHMKKSLSSSSVKWYSYTDR